GGRASVRVDGRVARSDVGVGVRRGAVGDPGRVGGVGVLRRAVGRRVSSPGARLRLEGRTVGAAGRAIRVGSGGCVGYARFGFARHGVGRLSGADAGEAAVAREARVPAGAAVHGVAGEV